MQDHPFPQAATLDGFQHISGSCAASEQVHLYTGNLFCRNHVVSVPSVGVPLLFDLMYNAQDTATGPLGPRWRHNFMMRLELDDAVSPTSATFVSETGRRYAYEWNGSAWVPMGQSLFTPGGLSQSGSDFVLTSPNGNAMTFEADTGTFEISGSISDSHVGVPSGIDLNRLEVGQIVRHPLFPADAPILSIAFGVLHVGSTATDTLLDATISVSASPTVYRLKSLTDAHGFTASLGYNSEGQLTSITDATGNRSITLGYSPTTALLTSITDPLGAAASPPYSTVLGYDTGLNLITVTGPELCVTTYGYGGGAHSCLASRIDPLGNEMRFGWPNDPDVMPQLLWAMDPEGNQIRYAYDQVYEAVGHLSSELFCRTRVVDPRSTATVTGTITWKSTTVTDVAGSDIAKLQVGDTVNHPALRPASVVVSISSNSFVVSDTGLETVEHAAIGVQTLMWDYRFDHDGNLWRQYDPQGHHYRFRWDADQQLTYVSGPFKANEIYRDNSNNSFSFRAYDLRSWQSGGNLIYATDPSGRVDHFEYDERNHVTDVFPGQGNLAIQGQWTDHFGKDGYVLCAFDDDTGDRAHLPDYLAPIATTFTRLHDVDTSAGAVYWKHLLDPRLPVAPDSLTRGVGFWKQQGEDTSFSFDLALASGLEDKKFNASFYTHSADLAYHSDGGSEVVSPLTYPEQFGRDITLTVTDAEGTQSYRVYNNAPGAWVTFAVHATSEQPVSVTVSASGPSNTEARISAICFDPYENRRISYTYDATTGDLTGTHQEPSEGVDVDVSLDYDPTTKLLTSVTDARQNPSSFGYDATYKDMTSVVDREGKTWRMAYDANGNLLTVQDPVLYGINPALHSVTYTYDRKNRVTAVTDALGHGASFDRDEAGNLVSVTDANGKVTQFQYTTMNRLSKIVDALSQETAFAWDAVGNLVSVTDPRGNVTTFRIDALNQVTAVVLPDIESGDTHTHVDFAYDGLARLVSMTTPNGTRAAEENVVLRNAFNLLRNPGFEQADAATETQPAIWWSDQNPGQSYRTANTPGPGPFRGDFTAYGENNESTLSWGQSNPPLAAGAVGVLSSNVLLGHPWLYSGVHSTVFDNDGNQVTRSSEDPRVDRRHEWATRRLRFDVPGDGQYSDGPVAHVGASYWGATEGIWFDELELYQLSHGVQYDKAGRPLASTRPDGSTQVIGYDHAGRVSGVIDPKGRTVALTYDAAGRVVAVTDPRGDTTRFSYDLNGNLSGFVDGSGNETTYSFDDEDRLVTITYPDATTEVFTYDDAGRVLTYTNNRSQSRTMTYDLAGRLVSVDYGSETVELAYDDGGLVTSITERNGDVTTFERDDLYRVVREVRTPAIGSGTAAWAHHNGFDENDNRVRFDYAGEGAAYGSARYGSNRYSVLGWTAPEGYDSMNRLVAYKDSQGNQTSFSYDVESRVSQLTYPNGLVTTPTYDVMGRVVDLDTTVAADDTPVLRMSNSYDVNGNRNGLMVDHDTFDYGFDENNQLLEECINRFVERRYEHFTQGSAEGLQLDASGTLSLLAFNDDFSGPDISADRWKLWASSLALANVKVAQGSGLRQAFVDGDGLVMGYPLGYSDIIFATPTGSSSTYNAYGLLGSQFWINMQHRMALEGAFEVQVDFRDFQGAGTGEVIAGLVVSSAPFPRGPQDYAMVGRGVNATNTQQYVARVQEGGTLQTDITISSSDVSGKLRVARSGNVVTMSCWDGSAWQVLRTYTFSALASALYVSLHYTNTSGLGSVRWQNLTQNDASSHEAITRYATSGTYTSRVYDTRAVADRTVQWLNLIARGNGPAGTSLVYEVAADKRSASPVRVRGTISNGSNVVTSVSADDLALLNVGDTIRHDLFPNGTTTVSSIGTGSFTVSSNATGSLGAAQIGCVWSWAYGGVETLPMSGRYGRYRVTFTGDGTSTPTLSSVDLVYSGTLASRKFLHAYDGAANLIERVTTVTEAVIGDVTNASDDVTGVSAEDMARVIVGAGVDHPSFPAGSTVTAVSTDSFTVSSSAVASASGATIAISAVSSDMRHFPVGGDVSGTTVSSVSAGDIAKLAVGYAVRHDAFPVGTRVTAISSSSFTVSQSARYPVTGATLDVVAVNNLNQLMRVEETAPDGASRVWLYTYDGSGNMTSKSDGTESWAYAWDEDNRLTQVALPGGETVQYRYDGAGRLLWRKKSSDARPTTFEWDGMDFVRETTPEGGVTRFSVVNGILISFEKGDQTYQVHADCMGHVRVVSGSGSVVYRKNYDAWGNLLEESGSLAGTWSYGYMGAFGCRQDADTSLIYCRARWLDAAAQRFLSKDLVSGPNRYCYGANSPSSLYDDNGMRPKWTDLPRRWVTEYNEEGQAVEILKPYYQDERYVNVYAGADYDPRTQSWTYSHPREGVIDVSGEVIGGTLVYGAAFGPVGSALGSTTSRIMSVASARAYSAAAGGSRVGTILSTDICKLATSPSTELTGLYRGLKFAGEMKMTRTASVHMGEPSRFVPMSVLREAVRFGKRTPDPRGTAGVFRYSVEASRLRLKPTFISGDKGKLIPNPAYGRPAVGELEVLLHEPSNTIYHFQLGTRH